ncbi:MAG: ABC transporter substrate-binding protein [Chloroflexi bacterium]|nr:ABC transporter substrate-binding protein [Chloroflexota bacterium]
MKTNVAIGLLMLALLATVVACTAAATPTPTPKPAAPAATAVKPAATSAAAPTAAAKATAPAPAATKPAASAPAATPVPASIKIGSVSSTGEAGIYAAIEKGYFKEVGITAEVNVFRIASDIVPAFSTGQLDVGALPISLALLSAADRGVQMKIVADRGTSMPGFEYAWLVLRKDLADSGQVKTPADLKGMTVAIPSKGSLGDQTVQVMIEQAGLKPDDVETVIMPFQDHSVALANKAIAAAYTIDPYVARGVQEGFSVKWIPNSKYFGDKLSIAIMALGPELVKNKDVANRFMVAYLKGARDYVKAFTTKEGRDDMVKILAKYTPVTDPKLYDVMEMPWVDPDGIIDLKSVNAQYQWFVEKGLYKGKVSFNDLVDMSYAEAAVQKLGKWQGKR